MASRHRSVIWDVPAELVAEMDQLALSHKTSRSRIASELIQYALKAMVLLERIKPRLDQEAAMAAGMTYLGARLYVRHAIEETAVRAEIPAETAAMQDHTEETPA